MAGYREMKYSLQDAIEMIDEDKTKEFVSDEDTADEITMSFIEGSGLCFKRTMCGIVDTIDLKRKWKLLPKKTCCG